MYHFETPDSTQTVLGLSHTVITTELGGKKKLTRLELAAVLSKLLHPFFMQILYIKKILKSNLSLLS